MSPEASLQPADDRHLALRLVRPRCTPADVADAQDALMELYRRHAPELLAFLAGRVRRADIEDLHQEVWKRIWEQAPRQFDGRHFRGWVFRIATNLMRDHRKRRRPVPAGECDDRADALSGTPVEDFIDAERWTALTRCLEKLSAAARELVRGRLGGEDYPALCARLGLDAPRAYKVFHTAVKQLRDCVEEAGV
jgi:RNA polymerase sigma-70 factor (ECF subfamily)